MELRAAQHSALKALISNEWSQVMISFSVRNEPCPACAHWDVVMCLPYSLCGWGEMFQLSLTAFNLSLCVCRGEGLL